MDTTNMSKSTKDALGWADLRKLGKTDSANRWFPAAGSPLVEYLRGIREPSRAYPHSYARAVMTKKCGRWLREHHPEVAKSVGLS